MRTLANSRIAQRERTLTYNESIEQHQPEVTKGLPLHGPIAAIAAVPDFLYTFDLDGRFTYANPALHNLLQRGPGEMNGLNFHDLGYPEPLASTLQAQIQEVIDTNKPVKAETRFDSAAGVGYYEYIFVPIHDENGQVAAVAGTTRDITERKVMENALRESQQELRAEREKLRNLFEKAPAFIATLDGPDFVIGFANEDYFRLIGRRDVLGKPVREALPEVVSQGYVELLQNVFTTGESFIGRSMEIVFDAQDAEQRRRYVDFIYQALRNPDGEITGVLAHGVDVTEQHISRQEIERLNSQLEKHVQERTHELQLANQEMEGFTYSVSHDLRSPLRAIVSSSTILLRDFQSQLDSNARQELERQVAAANKMAQLIDDLLKLSRLGRREMVKVPIDFSELAQSVAEEIAGHQEGKVCEFEIAKGMKVVGDPISLRLLLANLLENACKFSVGAARIEVGQSICPEGTVFWVRDHGIGFDMRYAGKLFLPFERLVLDRDFPGTGIGLANVKRIVEKHGGRIWAESEPGQGATFFFTLTSSSEQEGT